MRRPSCSGVTKCVGRTDEEVQAIEAHGGACTMSRKRNALPGKARCVRQGRLREGAAVTVRVRRNRLRGDCRNDCRDVLGCLAHATKDETEHAPVLAKARDERAGCVGGRIEELGVELGEGGLDVLVDAISATVDTTAGRRRSALVFKARHRKARARGAPWQHCHASTKVPTS